MILNQNREPKYSLYYIGFQLITYLKEYRELTIEELHTRVNKHMGIELDIDFLYLSLDWLYLINAIELEEDMVILCS